jgi:putative ABC transport system ATP-binding protein
MTSPVRRVVNEREAEVRSDGASSPEEAPPLESTQSPLYELRDVVKEYGRGGTLVHAIDGLDLAIADREFVVIAGPSGSGKSTLLRLLGALDRPSSGTVSYEGEDLARRSPNELAALRRRTFGFIFQQFNLIPTLTAVQNVEVAMAPEGLQPAMCRERADELLDGVGLAPRSEHLPSQLSGGEQQRVAIARALANKPRVLLADEPTGNLDTSTSESLLSLIYSLWEGSDLTIVLVTHDQAIARGAPRLVRLADGRLAEAHAGEASMLDLGRKA